jgi:hypothetical protein
MLYRIQLAEQIGRVNGNVVKNKFQKYLNTSIKKY